MKNSLDDLCLKVNLVELSRNELTSIDGGKGLFYWIGYAYGYLLGQDSNIGTNSLGMTVYDVAL